MFMGEMYANDSTGEVGPERDYEKSILTQLLQQTRDSMQLSLENYQSTVMASITQFSQSIENMSSGIQQISASSQELRDSVEKQKEAIGNLSESQRRMKENSAGGLERIRDLSNHTDELNELSTSLQKMLDENWDIADQLHILSINGSIEAARAGEVYGAPFKVVAQEISSLSNNASGIIQRQADSVKTILSIISTVKGQSDQTVESFQDTSKTIADNVSYLDSLSNEMEQIASSAEELSTVIEQFSGSIQEMKSAVEEINSSAEQFRSQLEREFAVNGFAAQLTQHLSEKTAGCRHLQEAAQVITRHVYDRFREESHLPLLALVRIFLALPYDSLSPDDGQYISENVGQGYPRYLTLVGTAGSEDQWNDRRQSRNHRVIPLPERAEDLKVIPMIAEMFRRMEVDYGRIVHPEHYGQSGEIIEGYMLTEEAAGSPYIPAQEEFVHPYGIASEIGYGGILPSGIAYTCFIFSEEPIQKSDAEKLKVLSPAIQQALVPFDLRGSLWEQNEESSRGDDSETYEA
jgi:methyl-accepting chemotaxis protein